MTDFEPGSIEHAFMARPVCHEAKNYVFFTELDLSTRGYRSLGVVFKGGETRNFYVGRFNCLFEEESTSTFKLLGVNSDRTLFQRSIAPEETSAIRWRQSEQSAAVREASRLLGHQ